MKRALTKQEEQAFRLCHHNFTGLTTISAAIIMEISQRRVQQLLQSVKRKAPQLFPILTGRQEEIANLINNCGFTLKETAKELNISERTVAKIVETMRKKGVYFERRKPVIQYQSWMDNQIVEKF